MRCPRCSTVDLVAAADGGRCPSCAGHFIDGFRAPGLFADKLGIARPIFDELAVHGPRRLACPGCRAMMTLTLARNVQVDICRACAGVWLDDGEHAHVLSPAGPGGVFGRAGSGLDLEVRAPRQEQRARFIVCCTQCDEELDLEETNWLVADYPWCPSCARPYTGLTGLLLDTLGFFLSPVVALARGGGKELGRWWKRSTRWRRRSRRRTRGRSLSFGAGIGGESQVSHGVVAERIRPADAGPRFARFFRIERGPPS